MWSRFCFRVVSQIENTNNVAKAIKELCKMHVEDQLKQN